MREQQSREVSQGKLEAKARQLRVDVAELKLPPIVDLACSDAKQKDWGNIVRDEDLSALAPQQRLGAQNHPQPQCGGVVDPLHYLSAERVCAGCMLYQAGGTFTQPPRAGWLRAIGHSLLSFGLPLFASVR